MVLESATIKFLQWVAVIIPCVPKHTSFTASKFVTHIIIKPQFSASCFGVFATLAFNLAKGFVFDISRL